MKVGETICAPGEIELNEGRETRELTVTNRGDRPVQVGSHVHFFEVNRCLDFDRASAYGYRLDVPSGTSMRFESGETYRVRLTQIGGARRVFGLNGLTQGSLDEVGSLDRALGRAEERGFLTYEEGVAVGFDGKRYTLGGSGVSTGREA
ncbi:urease subunit beta [Collinsella sp. An2]|uniref:urease subunit beta n=1 Tax=Collinsella sp. An2 TaxID=1965585 RepID=UPI000B39839E|nr:urease subunit beta [Collinsella sp. An2]OUP10955.1 urease subunit beta [Collinsella sp. An2]